MLLTQGITEHMATLDNDGSSGRAQIWLTIYYNKKGLSDTLTSNNACTAEQFDEFFMGFSQANPLFSVVDVGVGKEAADSKIRGMQSFYVTVMYLRGGIGLYRMSPGFHTFPSNFSSLLRRRTRQRIHLHPQPTSERRFPQQINNTRWLQRSGKRVEKPKLAPFYN